MQVNTTTDKPLGYVYHVLAKNNRGIDDIVQRRNVFITHLCYFPAFQIYGRKMLHEDLDFACKLCVAL